MSFGTVTDIDGNTYETVVIGDQLWMAENLKVTHYNNGDEIPYPTYEQGGSGSGPAWGDVFNGQYGVYNNDPANADIYGNLYNWAVGVDDRGVCPEGWHVPSDEEFMELEMELGMSEEDANGESYYEWEGEIRGTNEGSKLAGNSDLWEDGDLVNNSEFGTSGFNALPAGKRGVWADYGDMSIQGYFWTTSSANGASEMDGPIRYLLHDVSWAGRDDAFGKVNGLSIRCLQDTPGPGCTNPEACNYDESATADDGSCVYFEFYYIDIDCDGLGGVNSDWFCLEEGTAPNYCISLIGGDFDDDCSCIFNTPEECYYECGDSLICWGGLGDPPCEILGCTYEEATNYNPEATFDDGSCEFLWGDMNHDGTLNVHDVLFLVNAILSGDWF